MISLFFTLTLTLKFGPFLLCLRDRRSGGVLVFLPVFHSVLLSETLTLLITFEQWVLELWYFTWIFRDKTFLWVPLFFTLWPWPWSLTHFLKACHKKQWVLELWYFTWIFIYVSTIFFYPWPWSLTHFFENFNLANNFWTVSARASLELAIIGGICVSQTHLL